MVLDVCASEYLPPTQMMSQFSQNSQEPNNPRLKNPTNQQQERPSLHRTSDVAGVQGGKGSSGLGVVSPQGNFTPFAAPVPYAASASPLRPHPPLASSWRYSG